MTELVVRRLLVDMDSPIARHWCAGDAFRTALFNALSMSFPVGEQFFIDSVREASRRCRRASRNGGGPRCRASSARKRRTAGCTGCSTGTWSGKDW